MRCVMDSMRSSKCLQDSTLVRVGDTQTVIVAPVLLVEVLSVIGAVVAQRRQQRVEGFSGAQPSQVTCHAGLTRPFIPHLTT